MSHAKRITKKKLKEKIKRIRRAVGRLKTPPPQVIEDKRQKLLEEAEKRTVEE